MAKLTARGRKELLRAEREITFSRDKVLYQRVYLSDGNVLQKSRPEGKEWSKWYVLRSLSKSDWYHHPITLLRTQLTEDGWRILPWRDDRVDPEDYNPLRRVRRGRL